MERSDMRQTWGSSGMKLIHAQVYKHTSNPCSTGGSLILRKLLTKWNVPGTPPNIACCRLSYTVSWTNFKYLRKKQNSMMRWWCVFKTKVSNATLNFMTQSKLTAKLIANKLLIRQWRKATKNNWTLTCHVTWRPSAHSNPYSHLCVRKTLSPSFVPQPMENHTCIVFTDSLDKVVTLNSWITSVS